MKPVIFRREGKGIGARFFSKKSGEKEFWLRVI